MKTNFMFISLSIIVLLISQTNVVKSDKSLDDYLKQTINNLKLLLPNGDPDLKIPPMDPYHAKDVYSKTKNKKLDLTLKLKNLVVNGVSKFEIKELTTDMENLALKLKVVVPTIRITGVYDVNGKAMKFIPIYGDGNALIGVKDFKIDVNSGLKIGSDGKLGIENFKMQLDFSEAIFNLENFLGGGSLGDLVNLAVNTLAKPMFDKKKPEIEEMIHKNVLKLLEKQLKNVDIRKIITGNLGYSQPLLLNNEEMNFVDKYIDELIVNFKSDPTLEIDPLVVKEVWEKQILTVRMELSNCRIYGLHTLYRVNSMNLDCEPNTSKCTFTGELGLDNVVANLDSELETLIMKVNPELEVEIREIRIKFVMKVTLESTQPTKHLAELTSLTITRFSEPKLNIKNSGIVGKMLTWYSRLVIPMIKGVFVKIVAFPLRVILQKKIDEFKIEN